MPPGSQPYEIQPRAQRSDDSSMHLSWAGASNFTYRPSCFVVDPHSFAAAGICIRGVPCVAAKLTTSVSRRELSRAYAV